MESVRKKLQKTIPDAIRYFKHSRKLILTRYH